MSKARAALPYGTNLNAATAGFKNFGQFVAAINVSRNQGIPFADLKAAMTGITLAGRPTGQPTLSLGQAIQRFRPGVDGTTAAQTATAQANAEIASTPTKTATTTSTKANKTGKSE